MPRKKKEPTPSEVIPAEVNDQVAEEIKQAVTTNQVLPADPAPEPKPQGPVSETILVRHEFTDGEIAKFGRELVRFRARYAALEAELSSIKKKYAADLAAVESECERVAGIINDGFEMVSVQALVLVSVNKKKRTTDKVFYRKDNGAFIKSEPATGGGMELDFFTLVPEGHNVTDPLPDSFLDSIV